MLCKIFASQTLKLFVSACDSQFAMFPIIAVQYILQHPFLAKQRPRAAGLQGHVMRTSVPRIMGLRTMADNINEKMLVVAAGATAFILPREAEGLGEAVDSMKNAFKRLYKHFTHDFNKCFF